MVGGPAALRRKYRAENGLAAVPYSGSQGKILPSKNQLNFLFD